MLGGRRSREDPSTDARVLVERNGRKKSFTALL
jgi:hypothetical protein